MKLNIKIAALALAVMGLTVACKGKSEPVEDTTAIDTITIEEVVDTAIDTVAVEEVEVAPAPAKKAVKKAENKSGLTVATGKDNTTIGDQKTTTSKMDKAMANKANLHEGTDTKIQKTESNTEAKMKQRIGNK